MREDINFDGNQFEAIFVDFQFFGHTCMSYQVAVTALPNKDLNKEPYDARFCPISAKTPFKE